MTEEEFLRKWGAATKPNAPSLYELNAARNAPKKITGRGGTLSSLISEGGGAAGAAGGAALGTALLPGIGTVIGAGLGGFIGGGGGRLIENKVRDDRFDSESWKQALGEGAMSGVFSAAGTGIHALRGAHKATKLAGAISKAPNASTAIGGVDDVAKAAQLTAGKNVATRTGNSLYRSTLGIDDIVMPGKTKPTTIFKADELAKEAAKSGFKGAPKTIQRQVATQYDMLNKEVSGLLAKSKGTTSASKLISQAKGEVADKLPISIDGVPIRQELLRSLNQLGKGKVSAQQLHKFKTSLDLNSAFKKLSGELSSPLTAKETVDLALWKQADEWITKLAPAAKELTKRQSNLYGLAQGLGRMTRTPGDPKSVVDLAARVLSPSIRAGQNAVGRGLMAAGGAQSAAGNLVPGAVKGTVGGALTQAKYQAIPNLSDAMSSDPGVAQQYQEEFNAPDMPTGVGLDPTGADQSGGQMPESNPYPLANAIADIERDPKNAKQYMDYYNFVSKATKGAGGELTAVQKNKISTLNTANNQINKLEKIFNQAGGAQGRIVGTAAALGGQLTGGKAGAYEQVRKSAVAQIARALGEVGVLTDQDIQRALGAIPKFSDTQDEVQIKLDYIREILGQAGQAVQASGGGTSGYDETLQQSPLGAAF